jgi:hypothetical protein
MPSAGNGIPGFYASVALAVSSNDGTSFQKRGPVLSGHLAKNTQGSPDQGVGELCVVPEPTGKYLYAYYTSHERCDDRSVDICTARCCLDDASNTAAWEKYHAGGFTEQGLNGEDTPVVTDGHKATDVLAPHVVYIPALSEYMMVFCLNAYHEGGKAQRSGFYVAFSANGLDWPPDRMQQIWQVPVVPRDRQEVACHPTFVPDDKTVQSGWLYYGYSAIWGWRRPRIPHYLVRRRLTVTL